MFEFLLIGYILTNSLAAMYECKIAASDLVKMTE